MCRSAQRMSFKFILVLGRGGSPSSATIIIMDGSYISLPGVSADF